MDYQKLMRKAFHCAWELSHDTSTRCGALLVDPALNEIVSEGANRFPVCAMNKDVSSHQRPLKYSRIEHAERGAIYYCARRGIQTQGLIMVATWACCADCARAIVLAGIPLVVSYKWPKDLVPERWMESIQEGLNILDKAGVIYHSWKPVRLSTDDPFSKDGTIKARFDGKDIIV